MDAEPSRPVAITLPYATWIVLLAIVQTAQRDTDRWRHSDTLATIDTAIRTALQSVALNGNDR